MAIFSFGNRVPMCLDAQVLVGGRHRRSPRAPTNVFKAERYSDKSASGSVFLHDLRHGISLIQTRMSFAFRNQLQLCMCSCLRALDFWIVSCSHHCVFDVEYVSPNTFGKCPATTIHMMCIQPTAANCSIIFRQRWPFELKCCLSQVCVIRFCVRCLSMR